MVGRPMGVPGRLLGKIQAGRILGPEEATSIRLVVS